MIEILKFFKKYIMYIFILILFLIINATTSLSLPDYMSNMVNIGIQKNGIKNKVPIVLREEEFIKFINFSEDSKIIKENYILVEKTNKKLKKIYPYLENSNIYILNKIDKKSEDKLFNMFLQILPKIYNKNIDSNNYSHENLLKLFETYKKNEYDKINVNYIPIQNNFILNTGFKMLIISLIGMISSIIISLISSIISSDLAKELRKSIFSKVMSFSNKELDNFSTSSLITICTNDVNQVQYFVLLFFRMVLFSIILGIGGILKVIYSDLAMKYIIVISVLSLFIIIVILFVIIIPKFSLLQKLQDKLNLVTRESLTGIFVIRAFSNQKNEEEKFEKVNSDITKTNFFINKIMGIMFPAIMLIFNYTTIAILWIGAKYVDMGDIQIGNIMAFIEYCATIIISFLMLSMISIILPRAIISVKRINKILNTKSSINDEDNSKILNDKIKELEFKNVFFKYENSEEYVLKNISFKAKVGETISFIGSTGSGKSTIFNLLLRFYDVTKGSININNNNIKEINLNNIRDKIGYIPQKSVLFSGTIESNLKIGNKTNISENSIKTALDISKSSDFVNSQKEKLNYNVSQYGLNLSGGQRQRLSIARALVKDCDIYIFDDSFSALDYKTDKFIRDQLIKKIKNKIFLIISQRINSIKNSDKIIVLNNGEIVGIGKHEDLIKDCEVYKQIAKSQLP